MYRAALKIMQLALPVIVASFSNLIAALWCTRILGMENRMNLYFLGLFLPVSYYLMGIYESLRISTLSLLRQNRDVSSLLVSLILLSASIFIASIFIFIFFKKIGFTFLEIPLETQKPFFHFSIGMLLLGFLVSISSTLTTALYGMRKIYSALCFSLLASALMISLTYVFADRMKMGLNGYLLAIFIAYGVSGMLSIHRLWQPAWEKVNLLPPLKSAANILLPVGANFLALFLFLFFLNGILLHFDKAVISAFGMAYRLQSVILLPAIGLGTAMAALSTSPGIIRKGLILSIAMYFLIGASVYLFRNSIAHFMSSNLEISKNMSLYFKFVSLSYVGNGPFLAFLTMLEQNGFAAYSLLYNVFYFFIIVFLGGQLSLYFHNDHFLYGIIFSVNLLGFLMVFIIIKKEKIYAALSYESV